MKGQNCTLKTKSEIKGRDYLPRVAIIMVVGTQCNLRCPYCFYHLSNQDNDQIMNLSLLEKFIKEYLDLPLETFTFNWHGGEPLLAGLSFFEKAVEFQNQFRKEGQKVRNIIQTNGSLINEEWVLFFKSNNFGIGISLDGDKVSHDHFRIDKINHGSFDKVIDGINILRRYGIEPGILQTVTHDNFLRAKENFRFYVKELRIKSLAVNPYHEMNKKNKSMINQKLTPREFTTFLKTYINLWLGQNKEDLQIREIDNFLGGIIGKQVFHCDFNGLCWMTFCLNYDGKIYFCDRFLNQEEFFGGDFSKQPLLKIFNSSRWKTILKKASSFAPECRVCKWQFICHNGCSHLRIGGIKGRYCYCQTRKDIFEYLEKLLEKGGENNEGEESNQRSTLPVKSST